MVKVKIWGSLVEATGSEYVNVEGTNFIELLENLQLKYPGLRPQIQRGVSLAIDGKIYKESWFTPIRKDSEVVLMPFMIGG
jgi:molybdopterin converting factor small subunit